jgi:hydrogenase nickel incorporation protein HypB
MNMCDTCGCNITSGNEHLIRTDGPLAKTGDGREAITVLKSLLSENDHQASHNREHFDRHQVLAVNLMSSPGAGKTSLLEVTIEALGGEFSIAVIEGDLETENDAERIRAHGVEAVQISTGSACHLDAHMVHTALHQLDLDGIDILFIENVGNLVCPAGFDLGQHRNITLLSVPEGDDKPAKYPVMFRAADLVMLTKTDLLPYLADFSPARAERYLRELASESPLLALSSTSGKAIDSWLAWLRAEVAAQRKRVEQGETLRSATRSGATHLHAIEPAVEGPHRHVHQHDHPHGRHEILSGDGGS